MGEIELKNVKTADLLDMTHAASELIGRELDGLILIGHATLDDTTYDTTVVGWSLIGTGNPEVLSPMQCKGILDEVLDNYGT